ncbi:MAG: hypothetical protein ACXVA9_02585 [Bdellovibrionales bacterium]
MIVLAAAGVAMLIGLGILQINQVSKAISESAVAQSDISLLQSQIRALLGTEGSCRIALGGPLTYNGPITAQTQTYNTAGVSGNLNLYEIDGTTVLMTATLNDPKSFFGKLTITGLTLEPVNLPPPVNSPIVPGSGPGIGGFIYWSKFTVTANRMGSVMGVPTMIRNSILLSVKIDAANKIISCTGTSFSGTDTQPLPVCASDQTLFSNGSQVRCVKTLCGPAPRHPVGNLPNGDVICGP